MTVFLAAYPAMKDLRAVFVGCGNFLAAYPAVKRVVGYTEQSPRFLAAYPAVKRRSSASAEF